MSMYLQIDDGTDAPQIASNSGWGDICRWAAALSDSCAPLQRLCYYGFEGDVSGVADSIRRGMENLPPRADVRHTLENLLGILESRKMEVISVTDGLGPDNSDAAE